MKSCRGSTAPLIPNLDTVSSWVFNFTLRPLYSWGKKLIPIQQEAGWAQKTVWTFKGREKSLARTGIRAPERPASSRITTPTTLHRLLLVNWYVSKSNIDNLTVYGAIPDFRRILTVVLVQTNAEERTNKIPSRYCTYTLCVVCTLSLR